MDENTGTHKRHRAASERYGRLFLAYNSPIDISKTISTKKHLSVVKQIVAFQELCPNLST